MSEDKTVTLTQTPDEGRPDVVVPATTEKPAAPPQRREVIAQAVAKREEKLAATDPATGKPRDAKTGQFVEGKVAVKTEAVAKTSPTGTEAPARKPMPRAWKQDYAPRWEKLDPDLGNFIAELEDKREQDVLKGIEQYKSQAAYGNQLKQVLAPFEGMFTQQYGSVEKGIDTLLKISDFATRDPQGFMNWFAQQRGINLGAPAAAGDAAATADPIQQALNTALQPWLARVSGLESQLQSFTQGQKVAQDQRALGSVNEFLQEKDGAGAIKRSLPDERVDDFVAHIQTVRGRNPEWDDRRVLDAAYENLVWTVPEMRSARLEKEASEKREKDAQEAAKRKTAAVQVKGAPASGQPAAPNPKDRRAVIARAMEGLSRS